eukprot:630244-Amphidinium_carterae.1
MHGSSHRALDVVVVSQVCALLLHMDNVPHHCCEARRPTCDIAKGRRCATIHVGGGGSVCAKPTSAQRIDCLSFEDLRRVALWLKCGSAGHECWP